MVIEAGVIASYVIAWAARKAGRVAGRVDAAVDTVIDARLDRLDEVVAAKLGAHPILAEVVEEAGPDGQGQVSELTRQQVELALTAAARKDDAFGQAVTDLLAQVRAGEQATGLQVVAGAGSSIFAGDAHAEARDHGIAFGQVAGGVHLNQPGPGTPAHPSDAAGPPGPGRSSH